ncbi:MAG: ankyrin repeat domain-containing protein [Spirochaetaceae bacterium]|nr:ankyrin repeat domain-containing protein [Spirochaetaceae bacterium]
MKKSLATLTIIIIISSIFISCRRKPAATAIEIRQPTVFEKIEQGNLYAVKEFLKSGSSIDSMNSKAATLLCFAAEKNQTEIAEYLLENGAAPDIPSYYGAPIVHASKNGNMALAELLLQHGADINSIARYNGLTGGSSAILEAIINIDFELVRYLLSKGADINKGTFLENDGAAILLVGDRSATIKMNSAEDNLKMLDYILSKGFNADQESAYGTALSLAAQNNDREALKVLLKHHANPDKYVKAIGMTVREFISESNNEDLKMLLN